MSPLEPWKKSVRNFGRLLRSPSHQFFSEDTDATNELINDGEFVQPLTVDEIQALKRSGVHATVCYIIFTVSSVFSLQCL
jgi:hypothetical protein